MTPLEPVSAAALKVCARRPSRSSRDDLRLRSPQSARERPRSPSPQRGTESLCRSNARDSERAGPRLASALASHRPCRCEFRRFFAKRGDSAPFHRPTWRSPSGLRHRRNNPHGKRLRERTAQGLDMRRATVDAGRLPSSRLFRPSRPNDGSGARPGQRPRPALRRLPRQFPRQIGRRRG